MVDVDKHLGQQMEAERLKNVPPKCSWRRIMGDNGMALGRDGAAVINRVEPVHRPASDPVAGG